jgi:hypothetical protein
LEWTVLTGQRYVRSTRTSQWASGDNGVPWKMPPHAFRKQALILEHGGHYKVAPGTAVTAERQRRRSRAKVRLGIGCAIVSAHDRAAVCTLVTSALNGLAGVKVRQPPAIET